VRALWVSVCTCVRVYVYICLCVLCVHVCVYVRVVCVYERERESLHLIPKLIQVSILTNINNRQTNLPAMWTTSFEERELVPNNRGGERLLKVIMSDCTDHMRVRTWS